MSVYILDYDGAIRAVRGLQVSFLELEEAKARREDVKKKRNVEHCAELIKHHNEEITDYDDQITEIKDGIICSLDILERFGGFQVIKHSLFESLLLSVSEGENHD